MLPKNFDPKSMKFSLKDVNNESADLEIKRQHILEIKGALDKSELSDVENHKQELKEQVNALSETKENYEKSERENNNAQKSKENEGGFALDLNTAFEMMQKRVGR